MKPTLTLRVKTIIPSRYNDPKLEARIQKEAKKLNKQIEADYNKLLKWKKKLVFDKTAEIDGRGVTSSVTTENEIFGYLDQGTKKHLVRPTRTRALHWKAPPRSGRRGRPRRQTDAFSKGHWVSGIQARRYVDQIYKMWANKYVIAMTDVFNQALKAME